MFLSSTVSNSETLVLKDREFITRLAKKIYKTGLVTPAVFFLEMSKPLALLGSHAMVFFGPIVNAFVSTDGYYRAAEIFETPENFEFLISEIERFEQNNSNRGDESE